MSNELIFDDISPSHVPVQICGKTYELREATAEAARQWGNAKARGLKFVDGEMAGVDGVADCELLLISLCLFEVTGENSYKTVHQDTVRGWTYRITSKIYKKILEISELDEDDAETVEKQITELQKKLKRLKKESAKNVQETSTASSA